MTPRLLRDPRLRLELLLVLLAASGLVWTLTLRLDPGVSPAQWDEFIFLTNAKRLFDGQRPYLDYVWFLPPATEALMAGLFGLLGEASAGAARLLTHLLVVASALLWYASLRRWRLGPGAAALGALLFPCLIYPVWAIALHHWVATFYLSLALWLSSEALHARRTGPALVVGALAGLATALTGLGVQTQGAVLLGLLIALWWRAALDDVDGRRRLRWRALRGWSLGLGVTLGGFLVYLQLRGSLEIFLQANLAYVFGNYRQSGGVNDVGLLADLPLRAQRLWALPAPGWVRAPLVAAELALPALVGILLGLLGIDVVRRLRRAPARRLAELWALPPLLMVAAVFAVRPDVLHLAFYATPLLGAAWLALAVHADEQPRWLRRLAGLSTVAALAAGLAAHHLLPAAQGARHVNVFAHPASPDPALDGLPLLDAALVAADPRLRLLRRHARAHPEQRLFAVPEGATAYFLAMPPAVPDTLLLPVTDRYDGPVEYARTLAALEARPAEVLLITRWSYGRPFLEPPADSFPEALALAAFLQRSYRPWFALGEARFYYLASLPTPAPPTQLANTAP